MENRYGSWGSSWKRERQRETFGNVHKWLELKVKKTQSELKQGIKQIHVTKSLCSFELLLKKQTEWLKQQILISHIWEKQAEGSVGFGVW